MRAEIFVWSKTVIISKSELNQCSKQRAFLGNTQTPDSPTFTFTHDLFYFNFKSFIAEIKNIAALCIMHVYDHFELSASKMIMQKDRNKRNNSIKSNDNLFWIN